MKFKVVNSQRLNVLLTKEEVEMENIDVASLYTDNVNIKQQLSHLFMVAQNETGFNANNSNLHIEIIPIVDGDLLISVSKVTSQQELVYIQGQTQVYSYNDIEDLLSCLTEIRDMFQGTSSVYKMENVYFLVLYPHDVAVAKLINIKSILSEYGEKSETKEYFLQEHANCIIKRNAIDKLQQFFCNK